MPVITGLKASKMISNTSSIVSKVWSFCYLMPNVGVGYEYYLEQLTNHAASGLLKKGELLIDLLNKKHQQFIIFSLERKFTLCDNVKETISQSVQQTETLRQSILKKAFEGKLV